MVVTQPADLALRDALLDGVGRYSTGIDRVARDVIEAAGHGQHFGHELGHGIGLATHEGPRLSRRAPDTPLPPRTVFSLEPGIYLDDETGVRIEDLVAIDADAGSLERLTRFPNEVLVVGG